MNSAAGAEQNSSLELSDVLVHMANVVIAITLGQTEHNDALTIVEITDRHRSFVCKTNGAVLAYQISCKILPAFERVQVIKPVGLLSRWLCQACEDDFLPRAHGCAVLKKNEFLRAFCRFRRFWGFRTIFTTMRPRSLSKDKYATKLLLQTRPRESNPCAKAAGLRRDTYLRRAVDVTIRWRFLPVCTRFT